VFTSPPSESEAGRVCAWLCLRECVPPASAVWSSLFEPSDVSNEGGTAAACVRMWASPSPARSAPVLLHPPSLVPLFFARVSALVSPVAVPR
jgi:hypothetical protein